MNEKKLKESRRNEALAALQEMDKCNELTPELILETIMDGDIPWVKYEG